MTKDINSKLSHAVDSIRISGVNATVIPSPPHAKAYPGDHLFINCSYRQPAVGQIATQCLATARSDTVAVLRCVVAEQAISGIESVCVTFLAPISPTDSMHFRRVYRYSVLSSALRIEPEVIDESFLLSNALFLQSSEVQGIDELIECEPKRETRLKKKL